MCVVVPRVVTDTWRHEGRCGGAPQAKLTKWSERAAALDEVLEAMRKVPRLAGESRDYTNAIQALKLYYADSNQVVRCPVPCRAVLARAPHATRWEQVMLKTVAVFEGLCLRLRERFHSAGRVIGRLVLPKLKDKKAAVVAGVGSCLDVIFARCVELDDMFEDMQAAMDPKNVRCSRHRAGCECSRAPTCLVRVQGGTEYRVNVLDMCTRLTDRNLKSLTAKPSTATSKPLPFRPGDTDKIAGLALLGCNDRCCSCYPAV